MQTTFDRILFIDLGFASEDAYEFIPSALNLSLMTEHEHIAIRRKLEKQPKKGLVLAVGDECNEVSEGDIIIYPSTFAKEIDLKDGTERFYIREQHVFATLCGK